jgi:hypothetical protein
MRVQFLFSFFLITILLSFDATAIAQEGHPLTGTWYGDFGEAPGQRNDLTVVLNWDGQAAGGMINPGPNAVPIKAVKMDITPGKPAPQGQGSTFGTPPIFHVRFEVDAKNKAGGMDRFVFEGKIENPVAGNRTISGTWTCGNDKGDFRIRRY